MSSFQVDAYCVSGIIRNTRRVMETLPTQWQKLELLENLKFEIEQAGVRFRVLNEQENIELANEMAQAVEQTNGPEDLLSIIENLMISTLDSGRDLN